MSDPLDRWLVIFAKAPFMGRVKTRLARDIGMVAATAFYRQQTARLARELGRDPRWHTVLAVAPDHYADDSNAFQSTFPPTFPRISQGQGDLGQRMGRAFEILPPGPAVIVGSDIPSIEPRHIESAFKALGSSQVVLGPSDDGGYWLVGQKRSPRILSLFNDVRWSSEHTLIDTLANIPKGSKVATLETLDDVDDGADYRKWIDAKHRN